MDIDKPLDDIVSANRQKKRGRRAPARSQVLGKTAPSPVSRARAAVSAKPAAQPSNLTSDKIIVSNLPQDVNDGQVKELFSTTVGALRSVSIHYDSNGRSKGIAEVTFQRKGDASKAFQQYNNRLIDGKRPMKIEIILDPSKPQPLAARVGPLPANGNTNAGAKIPRSQPAAKGKKSKPRAKPAPKTAADLDAEMEDYTASTAAPAASGAAA